MHRQHVVAGQHVLWALLAAAALGLQPGGLGHTLQRGLGKPTYCGVFGILVLVLCQLLRGQLDVAAEGKVVPESGRELYFVNEFAKCFNLLGRHLVVKGRPDELESVGAELDALLQQLVDLADVLVQREAFLSRERCHREGAHNRQLVDQRVYGIAFEHDSIVGQKDGT